MTSKTVLILGGGVGGMIAANRLRARLGSDHRVVVIRQNLGRPVFFERPAGPGSQQRRFPGEAQPRAVHRAVRMAVLGHDLHAASSEDAR